jgi:hypothetical protein
MAKVEDKLVDLKDLNVITSNIDRQISFKLNRPLTGGTAGQVLVLKDSAENTEWKDLSAVPTTDNIRQIVNEQLAKTKFFINDQGHLIIVIPDGAEFSGAQMQALVRTGDAPKIFLPGDIITANWTWGGTTYPMRMAVAHHYTGADEAHPLKELGDGRTANCMDLQFIDALPISFPFEPKQAFYNNVDVLSAGQYTFTVSVSAVWGTGAFGTVGQFPYTFTLTDDVPADSQWLWNAGYSSGLTQIQIYAPYDGALLQTVTVEAGSAGTSLGTISELATGDFNTWARGCEGSNFWKDSAMRAWLNSGSTDWDSRRTRFTRKHPMAGKPGFLAGLEQSLRDGMASVKVKTEPHQTDGTAPVETVDLVRLPSSIEHYFSNYLIQSAEGFKAEGVVFDYWKAVASANNHPDVIAGWNTYTWLIARDPNKVARGVFTRSAYRYLTYSSHEGVVYTSGYVNATNASGGNSCLPVLSIA